MDEVWLLVKFALLGLLQGFTEPIPVSSSGHVVIAQTLFGMEIQGLGFEVLVNFASLLAVLLIYRADLIRLTRNGWSYALHRDEASKADFRFIVYLVIATIPAGLIGFLFSDVISDTFKGLTTIGVTLLITGAALWLIRNMRGKKNDAELKLRDAFIIGLAQAIALIPGISRSGATIVAAMGLGLKQSTALRFSFLMFIPVSIGGMILEGADLIRDPELSTLALPYAVSFICSLFASYCALRWFMGIMERGNLKYFSYYCFAAGAAILLFLA
ncbi:undecaprenyl-diphosphate phosphatase [Paenibacillus abyssi]|uniref:Undecaprenyl-diphosphatase n=1 Tax=Paenibacillus abyssi TaxID=1340531 RepID=A0A917FW02_9BACL|nr:undecaprenyl-diphosphate phosphatase [Paenibacillus abyssi]GGG13306.1 undecaprenyl-diphosphatase 2 [Paenibacillus abyssi]